jgi:hypothetical protein
VTGAEERLARAAATTARYRGAVERGDVEGFLATLAPDAVLRSPITMRTDFRGREELRELLGAVFATVQDIAFFEEVGDARTRALFYRARVGAQPLEEATLLRLDEEARITELTLWFRPLPGLTAVMAGLAPRLAGRRSPARGVAAAALTGPLAALTRAGDGIGVRLLGRR